MKILIERFELRVSLNEESCFNGQTNGLIIEEVDSHISPPELSVIYLDEETLKELYFELHRYYIEKGEPSD